MNNEQIKKVINRYIAQKALEKEQQKHKDELKRKGLHKIIEKFKLKVD